VISQDCWVSIQTVLILVCNKTKTVVVVQVLATIMILQTHLIIALKELVLVLIQVVMEIVSLLLINNKKEMVTSETSLKWDYQTKINLLTMLCWRTITPIATTQFHCQEANSNSLNSIRLRRSSHQCNNQ